MRNETILRLIGAYLLGIPIITSSNGLTMHLTGVSLIGPLYYVSFSLTLIVVGLVSPQVQKNGPLISAAFGLFAFLVVTQLILGLIDLSLADLGVLYKWFMPVLLFAVYCRWNYWSDPEAKNTMARVFSNVPLLYSILIVVSLFTYVVFTFNPTLFVDSVRQRFVGFSWGYNGAVNSFVICAYVNFILIRTSIWRKVAYGVGFVLLLSKASVIYFGLMAFSFLQPHLARASLMARALLFVVATPPLVAVVWLGFNQSVRSAELYGESSFQGRGDVGGFMEDLTGARLDWWQFVLSDISTWPPENIIVGNGTNIDRRVESPEWRRTLARYYPALQIDKSNKTLELDMLGHLDLFGLLGMITFAFLFYVYPFLTINLPYFKFYSLLLIGLSMFGGHVINNPQTASLFVFFVLFLRYYRETPPLHVGVRANARAQRGGSRECWIKIPGAP